MQIHAIVGEGASRFEFLSESEPRCQQLKTRMFCEAQKCVPHDGGTIFICGLNDGIGLWAAEDIVLLQNALFFHGIRLWCAIPYHGFADEWSIEKKSRYYAVMEQAERVITIEDRETPDVEREMFHRLADEASHLIAVHDGEPGVIQETIDYALNQGLNITTIEP